MLKENERVLIGFSGGPDSTALLFALHQLRDILKVKLIALHINHQIRGKSALKDECFCIEFCKKLKIPIVIKRVSVKEYALQNKLSIEEAARTLRYQKLLEIAKQRKCDKIALGHHANDNTETVLLNLTRGSGLTGLAGIPPTREIVIRPLIEITRQEIIDYLKANHLKYCHDLSNLELGFRRNFIRHGVIPKLEKINPSLHTTLIKTSIILRDIEQGIEEITENAIKNVVRKSNRKRIELDIKNLLNYNILVRREIIKAMLPRYDFKMIDNVLSLIDKPSGKEIHLSDNWVAYRDYDKLIISKRENQSLHEYQIWPIDLNSVNYIKELNLSVITKISKITAIDKQKLNDQSYAVFDKQAVNLPLLIRLRKEGDRFTPYHGKEMKLKDFLINNKISSEIRNRLPILCDQNYILWLIGLRRSNHALVNKKTKEVIVIEVKSTKES